MTSKALVILSGGQDSTTCLYWALQKFTEVSAITFDYAQRHRKEIEAAKVVSSIAGVRDHTVVELGPILRGSSPLISEEKLGQYKDHASLPGGLEDTFVPMRNQLFITIAANHAYAIGCTDLVTGVCEEDFGGYPDCRQIFIDAIENACNQGTFTGGPGALQNLRIHTPLMNLTKAESVKLATTLPGCYNALSYSHTAYDGVFPPTGRDHASLLRAKGFEEANVPDPLVLRAVTAGLMAEPKTKNYSAVEVVKWLPQLKVWRG